MRTVRKSKATAPPDQLTPAYAAIDATYPRDHCLIPLYRYDEIDKKGKPLGKRPLHFSWTTRKYTRKGTLALAESQGLNIGFRPTDRQLVVDVDPRNDGTKSFKRLRLDPSSWPCVVTGSGGWHYYLRLPDGVKVHKKLAGFPGIEFISRGGQVVAAGSIHPTGKQYALDESRPPFADAPMIPKQLLKLIRVVEKPRTDDARGGEATPEQIAFALSKLNVLKFRDHDDWLRLMMACHHASAGDAREEFVEWSIDDPNYADDAKIIGERWDSLKDKKHGITFRTLNQILRNHNVPDMQIAGDAVEDFEGESIDDDDADLWMDGIKSRVSQGLEFVVASSLEPEKIEWLWKHRIAIGKINFLAGEPDKGKSLITTDIAARVTRGAAWPNKEGHADKGSVLILSAEDGMADTLSPRLIAAGADLDAVDFVSMTVTTKDGKRMFNFADDLERLTARVEERGDVRLLIIDPISAYMGGKNSADTYKNSEVRAVLAPLAAWAERHNIAVLFVTHFHKNGKGRALHRVTDSLAFGALARCGWLVAEEVDDMTGALTGRNLFLRGKNNIAPAGINGLAYKIEGTTIKHGAVTIDTPRIAWDGPVSISADEALNESQSRPGKLTTACSFLDDLLNGGPVPAEKIKAKAEDAGISAATLRRAKGELELIAFREPRPHGPWFWKKDDDDADFS